MGVPVSWQMGVEFSRESSTFFKMVSSAPRAAEPASSRSTAERKDFSTSAGRSVDVRRINSRISLVRSCIGSPKTGQGFLYHTQNRPDFELQSAGKGRPKLLNKRPPAAIYGRPGGEVSFRARTRRSS